MALQSTTPLWEHYLLMLAQDTLSVGRETLEHGSAHEQNKLSDDEIRICEAITAENSHSFYLASSLLPVEKRRAMRVLYAFCRTVDNLVDGNAEKPEVRLLELRRMITSRRASVSDVVLKAWFSAQDRYQIPFSYAEQLLDGVEMDLIQRRYRTFEELSVYCYGVASTVGLMSMYITGFSDQQAIPYAIKLGVALQLTNILRDVGEDWIRGRFYLPLDELAEFGLQEEDLNPARPDERWRHFLRFQIARARRLYDESLPGISFLHRDGRFAVATAAMLYSGILGDIEAHDYAVFNRRAYVSQGRKLGLLLKAFWYARKNNKNYNI